jgi:DNA repair protein RadC
LYNILIASNKDLQKIKRIGPNNIFGLKFFQAISEHMAKEKISNKTLFNSSTLVADYLQKSIGISDKEHFVMLYLDSRLGLIKEDISIGIVNNTLVHPRELFRKAIMANAVNIIIGHNHPSGDPEPSPEDIGITRRLVDASRIIGIDLIDHIIVTKNNFVSLKERGLI